MGVFPRGPVWHRDIEQLKPRYGVEEDRDPVQNPKPTLPENGLGSKHKEQSESISKETHSLTDQEEGWQQPIADKKQKQNPRLPIVSEFGPHNPRRSRRSRNPSDRYR